MTFRVLAHEELTEPPLAIGDEIEWDVWSPRGAVERTYHGLIVETASYGFVVSVPRQHDMREDISAFGLETGHAKSNIRRRRSS